MQEQSDLFNNQLLASEETSVDDKGRVLLPKRLRDRLGKTFVIAQGDLGCLVIYTVRAWSELVEKLLQYSPINQGRQQLMRLLVSNAHDQAKFDPQGRLVLPQRLRDLAQIKQEGRVMIYGHIDTIEIWDVDEYAKFQADVDGYNHARRNAVAKAYADMEGSK